MIRSHHEDSGHFGSAKTHAMALEILLWESMHSDVGKHIRDCIPCKRHKTDSHSPSKGLESISVRRNREIIGVDLVGKLQRSKIRYTYICICMYVFTRHLVAYPIKTLYYFAVLKCLGKYFMYLRLPQAVLCNNGRALHLINFFFQNQLQKISRMLPY